MTARREIVRSQREQASVTTQDGVIESTRGFNAERTSHGGVPPKLYHITRCDPFYVRSAIFYPRNIPSMGVNNIHNLRLSNKLRPIDHVSRVLMRIRTMPPP